MGLKGLRVVGRKRGFSARDEFHGEDCKQPEHEMEVNLGVALGALVARLRESGHRSRNVLAELAI